MNPDELIPLTGVSPRAALAAARAVLAGRPGPREASIAHQAAAIVLRDFGDVGAAIREFRLAARLARAAADPDREADVLTSLGTALVMAGRTQAGLAALDDALATVISGTELGRILVRRGGSLHIAGRYEQAQADLRRAITLTRQAGDTLWQARALTAAALAHLAVGAVDRAEAGLAAAELLFAGTGQQLEIAYARHNRALVAFASGDLPGALRHLDDAAGRYADLGVSVPDAALDRCAVLLAAGLPTDALAGVETALTGPVTATKQAELRLAAARIALAAGRHHQAAERSAMARSMFTAQHREWWRAHATFVLLQARFLAGRPPGRLLPEARRTAARLDELRSDEAPNAWLLAGRIALALGRSAEADRLLAGAARAARRMLEWSERWRAVALEPPRAKSDPAARAELAALRDVTTRLEKAADPGGYPATMLHRERLRLEDAIRARALRATTGQQRRAVAFDADTLLSALGPARLVELVAVDGDLHVLVCGDGRIRRRAAGALADAAREVDFARFGLNRIARGHLAEPPEQALAALVAGGRRLDALLLGAARDQLGDGPVIVVPPGRLNAVPWALLPSLAGRAVTVAPSARTWLRASNTRPFGLNKTVLVNGPGLGAAGAEVRTLAEQYGDATVLGDGTATTARVLEAIDGAGLAHIAAHGVFRADSPLFCSLRLDDGPMTVHDVGRLRRAPYRLILPSCESALLAPAGADELLGLASALLPLGTAGLVASVAQVSDRAAAPLMLALHRRLRAAGPGPSGPGGPGGPSGPGALAAALRDARSDACQATADDPVVTAAGWSFIALGA